ncbi:MAG: hypothetical protein B6242_09810 [Anaerolineaceae bacterium 4572_78]|nr:MAG: hypothetical protein B6242_09810 [Anaerolineaceae bacterium 4572_78]
MEDKLVFILFYLRFYPIQVVLAFLFGMSQAQANEWIHRLTPILNQAPRLKVHNRWHRTPDQSSMGKGNGSIIVAKRSVTR